MNINRAICLVCFSVSFWFSIPKTNVAQNQPLNPLEVEIDKSDPVIPLGYQKRELSTFEINRIKREIEKLDRAAQDELQQGKGNEAFERWYRQLKLARVIDVETEIEALGKVGDLAWSANRGGDLRNIANRAIAIESKFKDKELSLDLLTTLATTYQQLRYLPQAISVWEQILTNNQQQENLLAVEENLQTLGKLHLSQFNYESAAEVYQQLLTQAQTKSPTDPKIDSYLETSIDIYDRTGQIQRAINARQDLIISYQTTGKQNKIPQLQLAIADDYTAIGKIAKAIEAYELAFTFATQEQQLAIAESALDSQRKLYQQIGKEKRAIAVLTKLLELQQKSYNHYGLINTYDTLGQIHLKSARNQQAKQYFQEALKLAQGLDYKVNYFNNQIKKL